MLKSLTELLFLESWIFHPFFFVSPGVSLTSLPYIDCTQKKNTKIDFHRLFIFCHLVANTRTLHIFEIYFTTCPSAPSVDIKTQRIIIFAPTVVPRTMTPRLPVLTTLWSWVPEVLENLPLRFVLSTDILKPRYIHIYVLPVKVLTFV